MKGCRPRRWIAFILAGTFTTVASQAHAAPGLEYRQRGDRMEGLEPHMVSGNDINLVSALIATLDKPDSASPTVKIRYYLPEWSKTKPLSQLPASAVPKSWIDVHERGRPINYYRMLKEIPCATGWDNTFEWKTSEIITRVPGLNVNDLGCVVRVGASHSDVIAPAYLYTGMLRPTRTYLFTLRVAASANVIINIYNDKGQRQGQAFSFEEQPAGGPFTVSWNGGPAAEGWYRLKVENGSYFVRNNHHFEKEFVFYNPATGPN